MMKRIFRSPTTLVLVRIVVAVFGGYAATWLFAGAAALWLPLPRSEAVLASSVLSFALYTVLILFAFASRRLWPVAAVTLLVCTIGGLGIWAGGGGS